MTAVTAHTAAAALVLCRRSRPGNDEQKDGERTHNGFDHGSLRGGIGRRLPNDYLYEHAPKWSSDRRDCQPEPGDGIDGAGRNFSRQPALDGDAPGRSCHL